MESISSKIIQEAEIPAMSAVLQQVLAMTNNPNTSNNDLEKLILTEPGLMAHILKLVNSAYYALPRRISAVGHAISILGFSTIKSLTSGLMLFNVFKDISGLEKDYIEAVWDRSLKSSAVMKILSKKEPLEHRDELFLAAMIHDIGHLILRQYFQGRYEELCDENPFPSIEKEQEALEVHHAEVGSELLIEWKFPEAVIQMVRFHHSPDLYETNSKDIHYINLCDWIADESKELESLLQQEEESLDPALIEKIEAAGWSWRELQNHHEEISASLHAAESSLH